MSRSKEHNISPYDLSAEIKGERNNNKPIYNVKSVDPYSLSRKTEKRLINKSKKNGRRR